VWTSFAWKRGRVPRDSTIFRRRGRSYVGLVIHLASFTGLLLIVLHYYLTPALQKFSHASEPGRRRIQDISLLLLTVLLLYLLAGLAITLRARRFIFPPRDPAHRTKHVDAWAEAGRRLDPDEQPDEQDEQTPE
jgi:hypothetical protein